MVRTTFTTGLLTLFLAVPVLVSAGPIVPKALPAGAARLAFDDTTNKVIAYDASGNELGQVDPVTAPAKRQANPIVPRALPAGTARLAFDETAGKIVAFDASGNELGQVDPADAKTVSPQKRQASACSNLSAGDVQKLSGWKTLEDTANSYWGDGGRNIVTNDKDFSDLPAQVCVDSDAMTVEKNSDASCTDSKQSTGGTLVGSSGQVVLSFSKGTSYSSAQTVTKESSISSGVTVSAKFQITQAFEIGGEVSLQTSFTNTLSDQQTATANTITTSSITQQAPEGKTCQLEFNNRECTLEGKGKVRFTAIGWVWFQYDKKVDGHYKWALSIESFVSNVDDRSSYAEFRAAISSTTTGEYNGTCE